MGLILREQEAIDKYDLLKKEGHILFEAIVGSQAYGTALPTSDIDKKFIYTENFESILGNKATSQLIITDDYVGFELSEFFALLAKQSPNMHELLWTPEDCIIYCNPLFKELIISQREKFISKQIRYSFAEYAANQIKKAKGLNKKIVNPMEEKRKTPLDFCWVPYKQGSINIVDWLDIYGLEQEYCGLSAIDHMKYTYHLFYDFPAHAQDIEYFEINHEHEDNIDEDDADSLDFCLLASKHGYSWESLTPSVKFYKRISEKDRIHYKGIVKKDESNSVAVSSIEKGASSLTIMYFNQEGYTKYCKDYKDYWHWVNTRNEARYNTNLAHGAEYDSKNMMHCHRLLDTCIEALRDNKINVRRENREQLLSIRNGDYKYEQLIQDAEEKIAIIDELFNSSNLRDSVDEKFYMQLILDFRKKFLNY